MIIFLIAFAVLMLARDCRGFSGKEKGAVVVACLLYGVALVYYVSYINDQPFSYGYGIPAADMLQHYRGALAISQGQSWEQLSSIAVHFESVGIGTVGYFIYATFLSLCLFTLGVFPPGVNVYLVYVFQAILSVDACVRFGRFYGRVIPCSNAFVGVVVLLTCAPYAVQAFQLMRDVYYMWLISIMLDLVTRPSPAGLELELSGTESTARRPLHRIMAPFREFITPGSGFLVASGNDLEGIATAVDAARLRQDLYGVAARKVFVDNFCFEANVGRMKALLNMMKRLTRCSLPYEVVA